MKNISYLVVILFLTISCKVQEKPVFVKVDKVKVLSITSDTIRLKTDVLFENSNDVGGKFSTNEIKVFVNGNELAQVSSEEFKVPARKEFSVPLKIAIPTRKILESDKNGILGGLVNSILKRSIKIQLKGDVNYKFLGFSSVYPIDNTQELKIKL